MGYDSIYDKGISQSGTELPPPPRAISQGQVALDQLSRILEKMGVNAQVFYQESADRIDLEIRGNNLGIIIGKHGQTLDALEFLMNVIHRKNYPDAKMLILDAQGYREKKISVLKKILSSARDAVISTQDEVPLDPMTPSDRKAIHLLCREVNGIISESRGEGINRRVVIKPSDSDCRTALN
jgi:spoIIIJ-associated protein